MTDDKLQAFAAWLSRRGIELTVSDRRIAVGFLALAGRRPVCAEDIARGTELARDASMTNDDELARVGAQLLAFEAAQAALPVAVEPAGASAEAADAVAATPHASSSAGSPGDAGRVAAMLAIAAVPDAAGATSSSGGGGSGATAAATAPGGARSVAAESTAEAAHAVAAAGPVNDGEPVRVVATTAPMKVMIRTSGPVPAPVSATVRATSDPIRGRSSVRGTSDADAAGSPARPRRRRLRAVALIGVGAIALGAIGVGATRSAADAPSAARPAAPTAAAAAPPVQDRGQRLRRVAIEARLPAGWREAGDAELGALASQVNATLVVPSGTPAALDRGLFVAVAPAGGDLVEAARNAERGAIRQLGIAERSYRPDGCELVDLGGAPTGRCLGLAERDAGSGSAAVSVAVAIYVRAVGAHHVVALALGGSAQPHASSDSDAIVASFRP